MMLWGEIVWEIDAHTVSLGWSWEAKHSS